MKLREAVLDNEETNFRETQVSRRRGDALPDTARLREGRLNANKNKVEIYRLLAA